MDSGDHQQLTIDLGVQLEDPEAAWKAWFKPVRRAAQTGKFLRRITSDELLIEYFMGGLPYLQASPREAEIGDVIAGLFPDMATAMRPENRSLADEFVCFLAEAFEVSTGATLYDDRPTDPARSFYPAINPALRYPFTPRTVTLWTLADLAIGEGWAAVGALLYDDHRQYEEWSETDA
ncbi:hypothetical protein [Nocardia sp. BMG51109]|uniref:hypothetical protein n=1 Tax=Nocardia sp. BMG51109 TaxID=1056816 RepID=UPI000467C973|nr:hypothetical protein [Nocardia sp. BMG51109]